MTGKRFYTVWLLGLALFINSCGNDAPPDAIITAVTSDLTTTISGSGGGTLVRGPIQFKVQLASDDPAPVANATVTLTGSPILIGDPTAGFVTGILGGTFVNPANQNQLALETNASGVVTVYYQYSIPACGLDDQDGTVFVSGTIGGSSESWKDEITISAC